MDYFAFGASEANIHIWSTIDEICIKTFSILLGHRGRRKTTAVLSSASHDFVDAALGLGAHYFVGVLVDEVVGRVGSRILGKIGSGELARINVHRMVHNDIR